MWELRKSLSYMLLRAYPPAICPGTGIVIPSLPGRHGTCVMVRQEVGNRFTVLLPREQDAWDQTVSRLLEPQGVETLAVRTGREALDLIESRPIHAVVLDTQMPQLGGMQVIRLIREVRTQRAPAVILLTEYLTHQLLREALGMQVFSVLAKPVDVNVLLEVLARVLRRYYENRWPVNDG